MIEKRGGVFNAAINVRLRGKVDHGVKTLPEQITDRATVGDVAANEAIAPIIHDIREALGIAGVRQLIEIDNFNLAAGVQKKPHEIGADKPRSTCNENFQSLPSFFEIEIASSIRGAMPPYLESSEGRGGFPRPGNLLVPVSAARFVTRSRDSNVPASDHQPSRIL